MAAVKRLINLLAIAAIAFPQVAIANPFVYSSEGKVSIIFEGTAASAFSANIWTIANKTQVANACGLVVVPTLPYSNQSLFVAATNQSVDYAALPVQTIPSCSNGTLSEPRTANFKTSDGKTVLVGQTAGSSVVSQYWIRGKRSGTFNNCGFKVSTIKNYDQVGADSIGIEFSGQSQTVANLNGKELPICRKVGNSFVKYTKLN